jgi:hypothetical protein
MQMSSAQQVTINVSSAQAAAGAPVSAATQPTFAGVKHLAMEAKTDFQSHEHRDPIIAKLNNGDTHYGNNGWCADFFFYVRNNHELLSMVPCIGAHPKHPFSKCERLLVSFVTWTLAFLLACIWELSIDDLDTKYYVNIIVGGIMLTFYGMFLRALAQCSCVQSDKTMKGVRKSAECVGSIMLCQCLCHGICLLIIAIVLVTTLIPDKYQFDVNTNVVFNSPSPSSAAAFDSAAFTAQILGSKISSLAVTSPIILFLTFNCKRRREMAKLNQ